MTRAIGRAANLFLTTNHVNADELIPYLAAPITPALMIVGEPAPKQCGFGRFPAVPIFWCTTRKQSRRSSSVSCTSLASCRRGWIAF
jgi:hypothetical protein